MDKKILSIIIGVLVLATVGSNYYEQWSVDQSKLPEKVELSEGFQRWITNLKNKGDDIEADEFRFVEDNQVLNTKWYTTWSADDDRVQEEYKEFIAEAIALEEANEKVELSVSKRQFIDYRNIKRSYNRKEEKPFMPNEIRYYGQRDNLVYEMRPMDCSVRANCYYDRGYFLDNSNDVFAVSEFSLDIEEGDNRDVICTKDEVCEYTFKLHVVDLINNKRNVYTSKPIEVSYNEIVPEL
jgi:hypothetical protein